MRRNQEAQGLEPIAIFAGRGSLPKILIDECQKIGRRFKLFLLESEVYEIDYSAFGPVILPYGALEKFLKEMHEAEIKNLVFIGAVNKPNFSTLKVDKRGTILLAKIVANKILGDDAVLRTVMNFLEKEGLKMLPIDELLDCVISKKGVLTKKQPTQENLYDIELATKAIRDFAKFDAGQSVVIAQKQLIAIEALEGTDAMIKRCENLQFDYKDKAILVKMKKPKQSAKADLPTIGVATIKNCHAAQICGIAIQANSTLVIEKEEMIRLADEFDMFLTVL
jgi:DUF1009 family protein